MHFCLANKRDILIVDVFLFFYLDQEPDIGLKAGPSEPLWPGRYWLYHF